MTGKSYRDSFKYPEGVKQGDRVIANAKHAVAFRYTLRKRKGTVMMATARQHAVYIRWDGCKGDQVVHRNFFDIIKEKDHGPDNWAARGGTPAPAGGDKARKGNRVCPADNIRQEAG